MIPTIKKQNNIFVWPIYLSSCIFQKEQLAILVLQKKNIP